MEISRIQLQITSTSCWCCPKNSQSRGELALKITSGCMWHKGKTLKLKRQLTTPAVAGEIRDQVGFTYSRTFKFILVEIMYCGNQQPPFLDMSLTMENKTLFGIKSHYRDNIKEHTHPGLRMERCSKKSADSSLFTNSAKPGLSFLSIQMSKIDYLSLTSQAEPGGGGLHNRGERTAVYLDE